VSSEIAVPERGEGESYSDFAYRVLCDQLIVLDIAPGAPLNDDAIARSLGIGRTPVREALKRLETDRLVVAYPRRGTFSTVVDIDDLAEISEIRQQLEPVAAARAARRASAPARADLRDLADDLEKGLADPRGQSELMRLDISVHRAIYRAAGSRHLQDVLVRYDNLATRIWSVVLERLPPVSAHIEEHALLLRTIADGDADRAATLTAQHVRDFEALIRSVL
jgi:DNA-binding GntR family transcriptional regulator